MTSGNMGMGRGERGKGRIEGREGLRGREGD